uniref:Chorionic somatomammotropin hormone 1 n=1 Tax=Moschus moschiferus TaxID=68415 RepID=A0A8C6DT16_MOSMO
VQLSATPWTAVRSHLFLLLVVSNLPLCQGEEDYAPYCKNQTGPCHIPLQSLFDRATSVANYNYRLAREMFDEFDKQFSQGKNFTSKVLNSCHTRSIITPGTKEEAENIHPGEKEKETYPVWSEKSSLTADDDDVRKTAFYKIFHCLHRDSNKISTYLHMLKCRFTSCSDHN